MSDRMIELYREKMMMGRTGGGGVTTSTTTIPGQQVNHTMNGGANSTPSSTLSSSTANNVTKSAVTTTNTATAASTNAHNIMENHDKSLTKLLSLLSSSGAESSSSSSQQQISSTTSTSQQSHSFTTPPSLSRRILNTQGCNYIDNNISNIVSLAADHFLSNILHNSSICQTQRIKGTELLSERLSHEKRILKRKRNALHASNKKINECHVKKEKDYTNAIEAGDALLKQ